MNILATKHRTRALESQGRPLGWVGITIVAVFVGLVLATALVGVQAATNESVVEIESSNNHLSASMGDEDAEVEWSWFSLASKDNFSATDNNSRSLAEECRALRRQSLTVISAGSSSATAINADSIGNLYCFYVESGSSIYYAGYVVGFSDLDG